MQATPNPLNWKEIWENADHIATVLGIGAAGVWGYFNFIKSRTYHPRMEMTVSGEIRQSGQHQFLVPRITLKNIGNSKIGLVQQGSGYRVWVAAEPFPDTREAEWAKASKVHSMFEHHNWIEPGETIFDEVRLIPLSKTSIAAKIEARLIAEVKRFPRRKTTEWNSAAIVGPVVSTKGACMDREHACKADQMPEDPDRTSAWEREKDDDDTAQQEEDPERSKEWEREKKRQRQ